MASPWNTLILCPLTSSLIPWQKPNNCEYGKRFLGHMKRIDSTHMVCLGNWKLWLFVRFRYSKLADY